MHINSYYLFMGAIIWMIYFCGCYGGCEYCDSHLFICLFYDLSFILELIYGLICWGLFICPSGLSPGIRSLRNRNIYHHIFVGCLWGTAWVRAGCREPSHSSILAKCKIIILFWLWHHLCRWLLISMGL